jgi:hypothetical protein
MLIVNVIVLLFYIFWGVVSFLVQGETNLRAKIKSLDILNILPNYKFFCPRPIRIDYHLHYRCCLADKTWDEWKEIEFGKRNLLIGCIWNPAKRQRKVFYKIAKLIKNESSKNIERKNYLLYRSLLNYVRHEAGNPGHKTIELRITTKQDLDPGSSENLVYECTF